MAKVKKDFYCIKTKKAYKVGDTYKGKRTDLGKYLDLKSEQVFKRQFNLQNPDPLLGWGFILSISIMIKVLKGFYSDHKRYIKGDKVSFDKKTEKLLVKTEYAKFIKEDKRLRIELETI